MNATKVDDVADITYTGCACVPEPDVVLGNFSLVKDKDFIYTYENNINAGTATITIKAVGYNGNFKGTQTKTFTINQADMNTTKVDDVVDVTYTGSAYTPEPDVVLGKFSLVKDKDFIYTYENNINAGTATIIMKAVGFNGNFKGAQTKTFKINKSSAMVSITNNPESGVCAIGKTLEFTVTPNEFPLWETPTITVKSDNLSIATVAEKSQTTTPATYIVTGVDAGRATITVKAETTNYIASAYYLIAVNIKQVTNIEYNCQKVIFVPAFSDDDKFYLKNNKVEFYKDAQGFEIDDELHNVIYNENGCTTKDLIKKLIKDKKTLYAQAKAGVSFYGIVYESWDNVFVSIKFGNQAHGLKDAFKTWLNDNGLKTVYFANNDDTRPTSVGNWGFYKLDTHPTLNEVNFGGFKSVYRNIYEGEIYPRCTWLPCLFNDGCCALCYEFGYTIIYQNSIVNYNRIGCKIISFITKKLFGWDPFETITQIHKIDNRYKHNGVVLSQNF